MDGVPYHYNASMTVEEKQLLKVFKEHMNWEEPLPTVYAAAGSEVLMGNIAKDMMHGFTFTANGFYGPQGRNLRLTRQKPDLLDDLRKVEHGQYKLTNLEMECAGLYALGGMLGHQMLTCCAILANRYDNSFVDNPQKPISSLIDEVLARLT
ncbi:MAG: phosphorylase, partial [Flavobacteriales bacterium]